MHAYDYALIRVVPRVERGEFVNVGVVLSCKAGAFLHARIELDEARLRALDHAVDLESVRAHLAAFAAICVGVAPRSTMIQTSPVHSGRCIDHAAMIERLLDTMVRAS